MRPEVPLSRLRARYTSLLKNEANTIGTLRTNNKAMIEIYSVRLEVLL